MILRIRITAAVAACCILLASRPRTIHAFSLNPHNLHAPSCSADVSSCRRLRDTTSTTRLHAAAGGGGGMGMATAAIKSKKGKNSVVNKEKKNGMCKKTNGNSGSSGSGNKQVASFDVNASMLRLEKRYEQLELAAAKQLARRQDDDDNDETEEDPRWASSNSSNDKKNNKEETEEIVVTSEFIVAARASTRLGVDDWVPVAQLILSRRQDDDTTTFSSRTLSTLSSSMDLAGMAVSAYCRELSHLAALGAPAFFKSVARNGLEYSIESMDSFHKHVYTGVVERGHAKTMTKAEARKVLGLQENNVNGNSSDDSNNNGGSSSIVNPKSAIKQAYRRLSFDLHPDRFQGKTPEEHEAAAHRFAQVKQAYESLTSGIRGVQGSSWYESLGGKARTDFVGPVNLITPLAAAQQDLQKRGCEAAIAGLDRDLIQSFVARNLRSSE